MFATLLNTFQKWNGGLELERLFHKQVTECSGARFHLRFLTLFKTWIRQRQWRVSLKCAVGESMRLQRLQRIVSWANRSCYYGIWASSKTSTYSSIWLRAKGALVAHDIEIPPNSWAWNMQAAAACSSLIWGTKHDWSSNVNQYKGSAKSSVSLTEFLFLDTVRLSVSGDMGEMKSRATAEVDSPPQMSVTPNKFSIQWSISQSISLIIYKSIRNIWKPLCIAYQSSVEVYQGPWRTWMTIDRQQNKSVWFGLGDLIWNEPENLFEN